MWLFFQKDEGRPCSKDSTTTSIGLDTHESDWIQQPYESCTIAVFQFRLESR